MDGAFVVGCGSGVVVGKIFCGVAARFEQIQHDEPPKEDCVFPSSQLQRVTYVRDTCTRSVCDV